MNSRTLVSMLTVSGVAMALVFSGCASSTKEKNKAKETAARYWQDKAYPGKSFDVQVIDAEKDENGNYRVKGIVDGETRTGTFNPESENFSEGYYSLAQERNKRVAELEQEVKYWKEKAEASDKDNYKLKVTLSMLQGKKPDDTAEATPASGTNAPAVTPVSQEKK